MRRHRRILAGGVAVAAMLALAAAAIVGPRLVDVDRFRPRAEQALAARLGRGITLGRLTASLRPWPAVTTARVVVEGGDDGPLLESGPVTVALRLRPLLSRRLEITGVTVNRPKLRIERDAEGRWSFDDILDRWRSSPRGTAGGGPSGAVPEAVHLRGARIRLADAHVVPGRITRQEIDDLDLDVAGARADGALRVRLRARLVSAGGGTVAFDGTVGSLTALSGTVGADAVDLAALQPYLPIPAGGRRLAGSVSGSVRLDRREGSTNAKGHVEAARLVLPSFPERGGPITVGADFEVAIGSKDVDVRRLDVTAGRVELQATGSAHADEARQVIVVDLERCEGPLADVAALAQAAGAALPPELVAGDHLRAKAKLRVVREPAGSAGEHVMWRVREVQVDGLEASGARVVLTRRSGEAGRATAAPGGPGLVVQARNVEIHDVAVRIVDETLPERPATDLGDVRVSISSYESRGAGNVTASARLGGGRLGVKGSVGPARAGDVPLDLDVEATGVALEDLRPYLESVTGGSARGGVVDATAHVSGSAASGLDVKGRLKLTGARLDVAGQETRVPELPVAYDIAIAEHGRHVALKALQVGLPGGALDLQGHVDRAAGAHVDGAPGLPADFELGTARPVTLTPEDVRDLSALLGARLPVALVASQPLVIDATIRRSGGVLSGEGLATLRGVSIHPRAIEGTFLVDHAEVALSGRTLRLTDVALRLGSSDLGGTMTITGWDLPQVRFQLEGQRANLDEAFGLLRGPAAAGGRGTEHGRFERFDVAGSLRVAAATFKGLTFDNFAGDVTLKDGKLAVDPVSAAAYQGTGRGHVSVDLAGEAPAFGLQADLRDVALGGLLRDGLGYTGLAGTGRAALDVSGWSGALPQALASLQGHGSFELRDGTIGALNVFRALEKAGTFRERSVAALGSRLASEGTTFDHARAEFDIDRGLMRITSAEVATPDATTTATGTIDLVRRDVDLDLEVRLSTDLSRRMREEGSTAASLLWSDEVGAVVLPLALRGPVSAPRATVDMHSAVPRLLQRRLGTGNPLESLLGGALATGDRAPPPTPPAAPSGAAPPAAARPPDSPPPVSTAAPVATIGHAEFAGRFLAPDLRYEVVLTGVDLDHAVAVAREPGGNEIARDDAAGKDQVRAYYASHDRAGQASIPLRLSIDGAGFFRQHDVVLEVTPVTTDGTAGRPVHLSLTRNAPF